MSTRRLIFAARGLEDAHLAGGITALVEVVWHDYYRYCLIDLQVRRAVEQPRRERLRARIQDADHEVVRVDGVHVDARQRDLLGRDDHV